MTLNNTNAPTRTRAVLALITSLSISAFAGVSPAIADAPTQNFEPPLRDLWQRGSERFNRQWLLAGPIPSQAANALDVPALRVQEGQPLSDQHPGIRWSGHGAWTDITDLSTLAAGEISNAAATDQYILVAATFKRSANSEEDLLLSSERPFATWVSGREVHSHTTAEGFLPDRHRVPVNFNAGDNLVVMRVHVTSVGPSQISMRAVPRGMIPAKQDELAPVILPSAVNELAIQTHFAKEDGSPVDLIVQAAGGKQVAKRRTARGDIARFDTKGWRAGAYEIRVDTENKWGQPKSTFLPWYHGDARDGVRALMNEAEKAQAGVLRDTLRMLAAMTKDRLGGSVDQASPSMWRLIHPPLMEFEELMLERNVRAHGFARLAYTDEVDGSTQFCRAYLPAQYDAKHAWPLIAALHGFNPANPEYFDWWDADRRHHLIASQRPVIVVEPHGRGNAQYTGIGERDVLRCIDEAKRRFSVDNDRVYLTGESMGGHGTWQIASRNPDVFAAAAPVYGGWDFRVTNVSGPAIPREARNAVDAYSSDRASSFASAENLLNVPLLVVHGDADSAVIVENSRHAVRMLQRWGYNIRYHEMPGWGHEDLGQRLVIADWLLTHTRVATPRTVRLRSPDLAAASAYWFGVRSFERPGEVIRVIAQLVEPGVVRVDTSNVGSFAIDLPAEFRGQDEKLKVNWNGESREVALRDGHAIIERDRTDAQKAKRAGLEGPLHAVLASPFMVVIGTTSTDPRMREVIQAQADALAQNWQNWQKQPLRLMRDTELSAEDEKKYSLILLGNSESNAITQRYAGHLPFKVSPNGIAIAGREWRNPDAVLQMIYPSPAANDRYVYVIAPTTTAGMYFATQQLVNFRVGFPVTAFDWIIQDGRRAPSGIMTPNHTFVAAGVFDAHWQYDADAMLERDQETASKWTLRQLPPKDFSPSPAALRALTGHYEVFPGLNILFRVDEGTLVVDIPGGRTVRLTPESDSIYIDAVTGNTAEFFRDDKGVVNGVSVDNDGGVFHAKRIATP